MSEKILVTGSSIDNFYLDRLRAAGYEIVNPPESFPPSILSENELAGFLQDCVGYIVGGDEWASGHVMSQAPKLQIVAFLGVGYQSFVDAEAAGSLSIPVTNTPGTYANSVAEFTIGLLLDRRRRIYDYATSFSSGSNDNQEKRYDLFDHSVGIVGMGHIGTRIAEILRRGFGADVAYFSRTRKSGLEGTLGIRYTPLNDLVATVESLIVMIPEESSTAGLLNEQVLSSRLASAPGLQLVNTSRPEINEPAALLKALDDGRIENVAFDGFYRDATAATEALKKHPKVLVTPHIASLTHDARAAMSAMCVDSVLQVLGGKPDPNTVNGVSLRRS